MALGYRYAERDADSQINWAEVGKNITDMLAETNRVRQEKRDAIDAATREEQNNLANAPQGQDQDLTNFTNRFAHNAMQQSLIDEKLLKSGQMPIEKYTLRRQNRIDGTNTLFELSKLYQDEFKTKMEGVASGKLQALNVFNMSSLEDVVNFNNSEAIIDSLGDGRVNIGLYENKIIDGKEVRVLSKDIAPVNVWRNRIIQNIPTFDVEAATSETVKNFGTRKDILYEAATLSGAGTITELMGPDFLATKTDSTTQKIVSDMNDAINDQISSYLTPYNLTSVLTQNTGKYGADSFTFNKEEAANDKTKILLKLNPTTQMGEMDDEAPNYKAQYDEAKDWIKSNMLSKMDQERSIKTTSQNQLQESAATRAYWDNYYKQKEVDKTKPVKGAEILKIYGIGNKGKKVLTGITQALQNAIVTKVKGIDSVVEYIGYNRKNGALEISGVEVTGKAGTNEEVGVEGEDGKTTPKTVTQNVTKQKKFVQNDLNNSGLLSIVVTQIPNPEDPNGGTFRNVAQAKDYYKRQYDAERGKPDSSSNIPSASNNEWLKAGWNQSQINEAVKLGKIKVK